MAVSKTARYEGRPDMVGQTFGLKHIHDAKLMKLILGFIEHFYSRGHSCDVFAYHYCILYLRDLQLHDISVFQDIDGDLLLYSRISLIISCCIPGYRW